MSTTEREKDPVLAKLNKAIAYLNSEEAVEEVFAAHFEDVLSDLLEFFTDAFAKLGIRVEFSDLEDTEATTN